MREALFKLTENCLCDCPFCDAKKNYLNRFHSSQMNLFAWQNIAEKLIKEGVRIIVLSGGEPLIEKELTIRLIKHIQNFGVYVVLNTSGVLFKNRSLIDDLIKCYPNLLVFSIDSIIPEQHNKNRKIEGLFERIERTINLLKNSNTFPVAIRVVITKQNYKQIPSILTYFNKLKVDCIKFTNIENDHEHKFSLSLSEWKDFNENIRPLIIEAINMCEFQDQKLQEDSINKFYRLFSKNTTDYNMLADGIFSPSLTDFAQCDEIDHFCVIESNGDVIPCCEAEHHYSPVVGNILNSEWSEIENSPIYKSIKYKREKYCIYCTELHNIQIDFTDRAFKVNERWR